MSKFKVGHTVWIKGVVQKIDNEKYNHKVVFDDGDAVWFEEEFLRHTPQVKSKWFEVENVNNKKYTINIDKIISLSDTTQCVILEECYQYELTTENYKKLKERLMEVSEDASSNFTI